MRLRQSSNFCYSTYQKLKLQATKVTSIYTLDKNPHYLLHHAPRAITAVLITAHYIQTVGLVIVVVIHHRRHCPPSPSLSTTPAIVAPLRPLNLNRPWHCHGPACGVDTLPVRRVECRSCPLVRGWAHCASATVMTAAMPWSPLWRSAVDPPLLLGPPPPVEQRQQQQQRRWQRRQQHGNVDGHAWQPSAATTRP